MCDVVASTSRKLKGVKWEESKKEEGDYSGLESNTASREKPRDSIDDNGTAC